MNVIIVSKNENAKSIRYMLDILKNFDSNIFLVSPNAESSKYKINKLNDAYFLEFNYVKNIFEKYNFNGRINWYFQQFLKYKIVTCLDEGEDFFIIDGDSIVNNRIIRPNLLCYTGIQKFKQYDNFYKIMFPKHKLSNLSFITNQMYFKKTYLKLMLDSIEDKYSDKWIEVIIKLLSSNKNTAFSEYQTYAEYVINQKLKYSLKKIKVFRRLDAIQDFVSPKNALNHYDVISYEYNHQTSLFLRIRMLLYYLIKRNVG